MESIIAKNRHDARDNRYVDSDFFAILDPLVENFVIVEELGDNEFSSCIYFVFQILNVVLSALCLQMHLWVSSASNTEIVSIVFLNEFYQINCIIESVFYWFPVSFSKRWISSKGQQVSYSKNFSLNKI